MQRVFSAFVFFTAMYSSQAESTQEIETDLLIAGATESGWAAAIQAARLGVQDITLVHDGTWYGGQFTEQALACVDENKGMDNVGWGVDWHPMRRAYHRSGLFRELMDRIEEFNTRKYGSPMPGKPWHGPSTFRPAEAEAVFREMIQPFIRSGQVQVIWNHYPVAATVRNSRLTQVSFRKVNHDIIDLRVRAKLTIDATDWGDVIQVAGAAFECGPDPKSRYNEPSAPEVGTFPQNEMNPITWAMIVEEANEPRPIGRPTRFDDRNYPRATGFSQKAFRDLEWDIMNPGLGSIPHWPAAGTASRRQLTVYSVRRIVDGYSSKGGRTSILLNYMNGQDYPLERLPRHVADALEANAAGASTLNIVRMSRDQRQIIFDDARRHALGVLYHLQNFVHDAATDRTNSFRNFQLSPEFGTADRLPPKPYIREGLRLSAMYMMREQDGRNRDGITKERARPRFSSVTYPDGLFAWQFHYDFHRTGRTFLKQEGPEGPWIDYHKPNRHTKFISDRCTFPLRSLVPESMDGLLGAQGNVGFSSIVSAAIRLHDQRIHIGQAAGATAAVCLREDVPPRVIPYARRLLEAVRHGLCGEAPDAKPLLLVGYRDLPAEHPAFVAINRLAAIGVILPTQSDEVDFRPDVSAEEQWMQTVCENAKAEGASLTGSQISELIQTNRTRAKFCQQLWAMLSQTQWTPFTSRNSLTDDVDGDGIVDRNDALLHTPNEPIEFRITAPKLTPATDGIPDKGSDTKGRFIDFCGGSGAGDHGHIFDAEQGFGWDADLSRNHRQRNALSGPRDTFIFTREVNTWECTVENGDYTISLCVGDSGHEQSQQAVHVEGKPVFDRIQTRAGEFAEASVDVRVDDGRLTIRIGSGQPSSNTCLNWVRISRI